MIKEQLKKDLFDKIPNEGKIAIYGACDTAKKMLKDLKIYKPNCKILGFIENKSDNLSSFCDLPVWKLKEFLDLKIEYDYIVMSTRVDYHELATLFDFYNIPVIMQKRFVSNYYRNTPPGYTEETYQELIQMFPGNIDKELYSTLFKLRLGISEYDVFAGDLLVTNKLYNGFIDKEIKLRIPIKKQYLEKINKDAVKILFDCGFYTGLNMIAYNAFLPNLKKVVGFEAIYSKVREDYIEDFLPKDKLEVVPFAVGEVEDTTCFAVNTQGMSGSYCCNLSSCIRNVEAKTWEMLPKINVITLDNYCEQNNIYPDLIKMDIEGMELPALKGGIKTIQKYRPQLAISIYHSESDFINIPLYLKEKLENYTYKIGHYSPFIHETVLYAIPKELDN